jgi:membrane-bound serine protease (ClpP class)
VAAVMMTGVFVALALPVLAATPAAGAIPVVELDGVVHPVSAGHIVAAIRHADQAGAPLLVLRMNTPGGLDTSMRQIIDAMLAARTPVAVFVGPSGARAASAGFVIAMASDVAAMAPGTNLGAAHPVSGLGPMDDVMTKKVAQDAAAYVRSKAERRGRNVEMAEKAVLESRSFTEREALDLKLIDLVAKDVPDLLRALDGRTVRRFDHSSVTLRLAGVPTLPVRMTWRELVLSAIARPELLFLLLLGALAGIGAELSHPGLLFPGVLGAFCLILFLFASQVLPVNWAGVLLMVMALALFAAEVKVTSYGLLTVAGVTAMILGGMMLVDESATAVRVPLSVVLPGALAIALGAAAIVRLVVSARRLQPTTGAEGMSGQTAVAEGPLDPAGWVQVAGERWRATADRPVAPGERVRVVGVEGLALRVRREG